MKEQTGFFAMMARMKYIERWALMRNSYKENISEHSLEVAMLAHGLAIIGCQRFGRSYSPEHIAMLGMYHDCTEIITGDMPTPVKYENNEIKEAYKAIEEEAAHRLLEMLPEQMRDEYEQYFLSVYSSSEEKAVVKAADKLSALIKCMEEERMGNQEFHSAKDTLVASLQEMQLPEVEFFCREFLPAYEKTLDELS